MNQKEDKIKFYKPFCSFSFITLFLTPQPLEPSNPSWGGSYAGVMAGYEVGAAKIIASGEPTYSNNLGFEGKGAEFVFGYGKSFNKYYLGLETSFAAFNTHGKSTIQSDTPCRGELVLFSTKITKKDSVGFFVRTGYHPTDESLLYAKFGIVSSQFNFNLKNEYSCHHSPYDYSFNYKKRLKGFSTGLGAEIKLTQVFLGRIEVSHIKYGEKLFGFNLLGIEEYNVPDDFWRTKLKLQSNEIKFGIIAPLD